MDDESGELIEPMEEVPLMRLYNARKTSSAPQAR